MAHSHDYHYQLGITMQKSKTLSMRLQAKKIRDYYVLLHYNLNSHPIYKKDVLKKLGKNLTFSWFGFYATVVKTLD